MGTRTQLRGYISLRSFKMYYATFGTIVRGIIMSLP